MAAFTSLAVALGLRLALAGKRRQRPKPKRGRPRKPQPNWWDRDDPPRVDHRRTQGDTEWVVALVDNWKAKAAREQRRPIDDLSDREALAHLLYEGAPAAVRKGKLDRTVLDEIKACLRTLARNADTKRQQQRALPTAVEQFQGDRLAWWVKRLSEHRTPRKRRRRRTRR